MLNLHRGITHSFLMAPFWGVLVGSLAHVATRRRHRWTDLTLLAVLALLLHGALDLLTSYGTQIFAPLSRTPYSLPLLFIADPWAWLLLGTALVLTWRGRSLLRARLGLGAFTAYVALCGALSIAAQAQAQHRARELGPGGHAVLALPQPLVPFHWKLVVIDGEYYHTSYLDLLARTPHAPAPPGAGVMARNWAAYQPGDALQWTKRHRFGDDPMMRGFARFAWARDEFREFRRFALLPIMYTVKNQGVESGCGWFSDLRFETPAVSPPFRFGMCHGPVSGKLAKSVGWSLTLQDPPPLAAP